MDLMNAVSTFSQKLYKKAYWLTVPNFRKNRTIKKIMDEATETFLELLLLGMYISFKLDDKFRQNIEDFTGSYRFRDQSRGVDVLLTFADGEMKWSERPKPEADVTITFKDGGALMRFLLAEKKDILQSILHNEVQVTGNLNYLYKFGYMANYLLLDYAGKLTKNHGPAADL